MIIYFIYTRDKFMTEILAVFRSRSQAIDCNARLRAAGIPAGLINTPKEANVGCGLSIKFPHVMLERAKVVVRSGGYSAFYGFFKDYSTYGKTIFGKIG